MYRMFHMDWVRFQNLTKNPKLKNTTLGCEIAVYWGYFEQNLVFVKKLLGISLIEPYPNPQVEKYNPGSIVHECKWIQYLTLKWGCIEADTVFEIESNQSMWNTVLYLAFAFHELFTGKQQYNRYVCTYIQESEYKKKIRFDFLIKKLYYYVFEDFFQFSFSTISKLSAVRIKLQTLFSNKTVCLYYSKVVIL